MGAIEVSEADLWPRTTAEQGFILRTVCADDLLGIAAATLRETAIWIEPPESALGLHDFDRDTMSTDPGEHGSDFGVTVEIHGLRRWCRAAMGGSLEMLLPLYAPDDRVLLETDAGEELRGKRRTFLSCGHRERLGRELTAARDRLSSLRLPVSPALQSLLDDFDASVIRVNRPAPEETLQRWIVDTYLDRWTAGRRAAGSGEISATLRTAPIPASRSGSA